MFTTETTKICSTGSEFSLMVPWAVTLILAMLVLTLTILLLWKLRQDKRKLELEERELAAQEETVKTQQRLLDKEERNTRPTPPAFTTGGGKNASQS